MEFLNPAALYGLLALPLLLIPYLINGPSGLSFEPTSVHGAGEACRWPAPGRLRLPLIFFLQLFVADPIDSCLRRTCVLPPGVEHCNCLG